MSRIGKLPIKLPEGVSLEIERSTVSVKGPKGELEKKYPRELMIEEKDGVLTVSVKKETPKSKALHGTFRSLIANMVKGVSEGWKKELELVGTGYRAEVTGNKLILAIGYSHPVEIEAPEGITFKVEKSDLTVEGIDKEVVGEISAKIRAVRPPEPYKGKGIKYKDEVVRRKPGKAARAAGAAA